MILDRDVFGTGDYGEYGVSLSGGRIAFGVGRGGRQQTICGLIDVADGRWHHVALTRRFADGVMRIYVDGTESAQGVGPAGDISYRDGRPTGVSSDPFLVIGASKADDGAGGHGFSGALDELRLSSSIRYSSPFDRPIAPFTADAETALLFHFDEGPGRSLPVERRRHVGPRHPRPVPPRRLGDARPALRGRRAVPAAAAEDVAPRRGRQAHRARAGRRPGTPRHAGRRHARLTLRAAADPEHPLRNDSGVKVDSGVVSASIRLRSRLHSGVVRYGSNAVAVASVPALQNSPFAFQ